MTASCRAVAITPNEGCWRQRHGRARFPQRSSGVRRSTRGRITVTLALNRSPCRDFARALVRALADLQWRSALAFQHSRFILASRGACTGRVGKRGSLESATMTGDLQSLRDAGREPCVLQLGTALALSGRELLQTLERRTGRIGPVRLED